MNKNLLLKLHRWITLIFALPLAVVVVTGLILSFEPAFVGGAEPGAITPQAVADVLTKFDPDGKARGLMVRGYAGIVSIAGAQRGVATHVDLATNTQVADPGILANLFLTSRQLHETLLLNMEWLVIASTIAMLVLIGLGLVMGWQRLRNTVSGWHKGTAWFALPLVVLSPLTGVMLAFHIGQAAPPATATSKPPAIAEAVRIVAAEHDLASVSWIRPIGGSLLARLDDGGEMRVFNVTRDGLVATPRSWPRLLHEGNWGGYVSVAINVITSLALIMLMGSGLVIWVRRQFRPRNTRAARTVSA
jgi:uncharacterized iron-regulated membrane protein